MPSVRYYNQTAPFWDFIASMEEQGRSHPLFEGSREEPQDNEAEQANPWEGWGFPFGSFPHRGRHGGSRHQHGPPPPPPPPEHEGDGEEGPSEPRGPPPPFSDKPEHDHGHGPGPHRGPPGGRGMRCGGRGRGGWGGRGRGGPFGQHGPMGGFGNLAEMFQSQIFGDHNANKEKTEDFKPEVDVFDTSDSFIVHVSLPGAKKEDVGVNWDVEKSELSIAGVIYRPGDEELLKTLALDERKVGAFERKVRLGSRANPAQVEVDAISAKMEDGILRIEVPKLDSGYVEIKKVDIE